MHRRRPEWTGDWTYDWEWDWGLFNLGGYWLESSCAPLEPVCGCEEAGQSFCNYDLGDAGFCEACSDRPSDNVVGSYDGCHNWGLPEAGADDCVRWCSEPPAPTPPPSPPSPPPSPYEGELGDWGPYWNSWTVTGDCVVHGPCVCSSNFAGTACNV